MSKVGGAIKMYVLLASRGKMKINQLAEELEVSETSVRLYRDALEQAGIYIDSTTGKYGGYVLQNNNSLFDVDISEDENIALTIALENLKQNNFIYTKEIQSIIDKFNCIKNKSEASKGDINYVLKQARPNCNKDIEKSKNLKIIDAILTKRKIKIDYISLTNGQGVRVVQPYATYQYKGDMYLVGYCEKRKEILDFKSLRINKIEILDEKFKIPKEFNLKSILDKCIGIYKDKEINLKLKITKPMANIVSEKIWVDNQKITWIDHETILFEATMRGMTEIISWILGMGSLAEVIEPQELKDAIVEEVKKMKKIYNF